MMPKRVLGGIETKRAAGPRVFTKERPERVRLRLLARMPRSLNITRDRWDSGVVFGLSGKALGE